MQGSAEHEGVNHRVEGEKAPVLVAKKIRDAILDETFKPGDRLTEPEVGKMFEVRVCHKISVSIFLQN